MGAAATLRTIIILSQCQMVVEAWILSKATWDNPNLFWAVCKGSPFPFEFCVVPTGSTEAKAVSQLPTHAHVPKMR